MNDSIKINADYIREQVRRFEAQFERVDERHYKDPEYGDLIPVIDENLFERTADLYPRFLSRIGKEKTDIIPGILPYDGGIDISLDGNSKEDRWLLHVSPEEAIVVGRFNRRRGIESEFLE